MKSCYPIARKAFGQSFIKCKQLYTITIIYKQWSPILYKARCTSGTLWSAVLPLTFLLSPNSRLLENQLGFLDKKEVSKAKAWWHHVFDTTCCLSKDIFKINSALFCPKKSCAQIFGFRKMSKWTLKQTLKKKTVLNKEYSICCENSRWQHWIDR